MNTINVSREKQNCLESDFAFIGNVLRDDDRVDSIYSFMLVSVFDKILNEDECAVFLDDDGCSVNVAFDEKLYHFTLDLLDKFECLKVKRGGIKKNKLKFKNILNQKVLYPKPYNHSQARRFVLAIPECEAAYFESWDYTHYIYFKNPCFMDNIYDLVKNAGLYVLEQRIVSDQLRLG